VGRSQQFMTQCLQAAKVTSQLVGFDKSTLLSKTQHLAAIHTLPQESWPAAVEHVVKKSLSAKDTQEAVKKAIDGSTPKQATALFAGKTSQRELARIFDLRERVSRDLDKHEDLQEKWLVWFKESDPVDVKEVQQKRIEFEDIVAERKSAQEQEKQSELPNLLLADPPWKYSFSNTDNRQIENQYPTATVDEIIDMRPETQADCVLFLWATAPKLKEALEVLEGWGFEYKTHAVWDKQKIGMGYWFRGQHELLLVGTKGNAAPPEAKNRQSSIFSESRSGHSLKPECVYGWIEAAFAENIKLEMFARRKRNGWKTWGNET